MILEPQETRTRDMILMDCTVQHSPIAAPTYYHVLLVRTRMMPLLFFALLSLLSRTSYGADATNQEENHRRTCTTRSITALQAGQWPSRYEKDSHQLHTQGGSSATRNACPRVVSISRDHPRGRFQRNTEAIAAQYCK